MLIGKTGYYKGIITDGALGESSGGFPQLVLALTAEQVFYEETEEWIAADPEANEITGYIILIDSKDRVTRGMEQAKQILEWDGASLLDLMEMEMAGVPIQFRVEENTWDNKTTLKVTWIDPIGASPTRSLRKIDAAGAKALQSKYAAILSKSKSPAAPATAASKKRTTTEVTTTKKKTTTKAKSKDKAATAARPQMPGRPQQQAEPPMEDAVLGECTTDEAWEACVTMRDPKVDDGKLSEIWLKHVAEISGGDESTMTDQQWYQVRVAVLGEIGA